jgi:hypothetical protein
MADTIPMRVTEASPGYVKFHARADGRHVNPLGGVHGGFAAGWPISSVRRSWPIASAPCGR